MIMLYAVFVERTIVKAVLLSNHLRPYTIKITNQWPRINNIREVDVMLQVVG